MKTLITKNYKKAQTEVSYKDIFDEAVIENSGNKIEAAKKVLDIATNGVWASWDEYSISEKIMYIINKYSENEENITNEIVSNSLKNIKKAQLDITECSICGKTKNRDQMANNDVCQDCNDKDNYENS